MSSLDLEENKRSRKPPRPLLLWSWWHVILWTIRFLWNNKITKCSNLDDSIWGALHRTGRLIFRYSGLYQNWWHYFHSTSLTISASCTFALWKYWISFQFSCRCSNIRPPLNHLRSCPKNNGNPLCADRFCGNKKPKSSVPSSVVGKIITKCLKKKVLFPR